jgi:hypothetical protein
MNIDYTSVSLLVITDLIVFSLTINFFNNFELLDFNTIIRVLLREYLVVSKITLTTASLV